MSKSTKAQSFEQQLTDLENVVKNMESGDLTLEEALKQFELGVKLTQSCQTALDSAKLRIQQLTKDQELKPFSSADNQE